MSGPWMARAERALAFASALCIVALLIGPCRAQADERPAAETLTLADAVQQALLHSPDLELARFSVREAELALQEAEIDRLAGRPISELDDARRALQDAQAGFLEALADVALQVEEAFYRAVRAGELLKLQELSEAQAQRQFTVAKTRYDAGLIAQHELLDVELRKDQAVVDLDAARERRDDALRELAQWIGASNGERIEPVADETSSDILTITLEEALREAEASRKEIRSAARARDVALHRLRLAEAIDAPPVERMRNDMELEKAEIHLAKAKASVRADVRQSFNALMSAAIEIDFSRRSLDLAKRRLDVARMRYDAGLIPFLDLVNAESAHARASLDAAGAVWDYSLEKARFLRKIGQTQLPPLPEPIASWIAGWSGE